MKFLFLLITIFITSLFADANITIIQKPICFGNDRVNLTKDYIKIHYDLDAKDIQIDPKIIVLHYTAISTLDKSFAYFKPEGLGNKRPDIIKAGLVNTSAQFLVDRDGTIYQLMPDNWMARHVIGLNMSAIGIENVGTEDTLTKEQIEANIKLVGHLKTKYPNIEYLIGHSQYKQFDGTPYWLEKDKSYRTRKSDPGNGFLKAVIEGTKELGLKTLK